MTKQQKIQVAKISVFMTSIFIIFLSVTYAFINLTIGGEKRQVITAGSLELELIEDENNLTITNALPMYDEVGMIQDAFTFRLQNKGTTSVNYKVKLVDITTGDKLSVNDVRYGLVKDGMEIIDSLSSLNEGIIDEGKIDADIKIEYALRLWIREDLKDNELIRDKGLSFRIDVEESQEIQVSYAGVIDPVRITYFSEADGPYCLNTSSYCMYAPFTRTVVFENKIMIPENIPANQQWDVSVKKDGSVMAYVEEIAISDGNKPLYKLHFQGNGKVIANPDSSSMFAKFFYLESIEGLEYFDTSNATNMSEMFDMTVERPYIYSTEPVIKTLDLSSFDTSSVTNTSDMFAGCESLTSLDISSFDISKSGISDALRSLNKDCLIIVKDQMAKDWVLSQHSDFTNVVIKNS